MHPESDQISVKRTFANVKCKVVFDDSGVASTLPGLLTPDGVLGPLLDYFLLHSQDRSLKWKLEVRKAVRLFLEYLDAQQMPLPTDYRLFMGFAVRLYTGSIDWQSGDDQSGLYWKPRRDAVASKIVNALTEFFDYLAESNPSALKLNPKTRRGAYEAACVESAYQFKRDRAFLGHTWAQNAPADEARFVSERKWVSVADADPPAFPDARFEELLFDGFRVGSRHDWRGMLITLLLHGGGFRVSEPFHMFVQDVAENPTKPGTALVTIGHPSQGAAPDGWRSGSARSREAYLLEEFGLPPRTRMLGKAHAGWKGGLHEGSRADPFKKCYWFLPVYGQWFWEIWLKYLLQLSAMPVRHHPFALVNVTRQPVGNMYSIDHYCRSHAGACERIGLSSKKELGTTPHGHRHAYAQRLKRAGLSPKFIQRYMHHAALESQAIYTRPSRRELEDGLKSAAERLNDSLPLKRDPDSLRALA